MLENPGRGGARRLGEILIERRVISEEQLDNGLRLQLETGCLLGEALVRLGYATPEQIDSALSLQERYGRSAITEIAANPRAASALSERFCRARKLLPIDFLDSGVLVLAMVNPADVISIDDVRQITGREVAPVATTLGALNEAWGSVYSARGGNA